MYGLKYFDIISSSQKFFLFLIVSILMVRVLLCVFWDFDSIWKTSKTMRTEWEGLSWIPQNETPIIISPSKVPTRSPLVIWRPSDPNVSWWCGCWSRGLVNSCLYRYLHNECFFLKGNRKTIFLLTGSPYL